MDRRTALRTLAAGVALPVLSPADLYGLRSARTVVQCGVPPQPFIPATLSTEQLETVSIVADTILPPTETPGASDVGVPEFIDLMLTEWYDPDEVDVFLAGLAGLDEQARTRFGTSFNEASPDQHRTLVQDLDDGHRAAG